MKSWKSISKRKKLVVVLVGVALVINAVTIGYLMITGNIYASNKLVSMKSYGGLCEQGPCPPMDIIIYKNGQVNLYGAPVNKQLDPASLQDLKDTIMRTDFDRMHKFAVPGRCDNYGDSSDYKITFYTSSGKQQFDTCGHSLPDSRLKTLLDNLQNNNYTGTTEK